MDRTYRGSVQCPPSALITGLRDGRGIPASRLASIDRSPDPELEYFSRRRRASRSAGLARFAPRRMECPIRWRRSGIRSPGVRFVCARTSPVGAKVMNTPSGASAAARCASRTGRCLSRSAQFVHADVVNTTHPAGAGVWCASPAMAGLIHIRTIGGEQLWRSAA